MIFELTPEAYGRFTGRSAKDIRRCYLPESERENPNARLRLRVETNELMDNVTDIRYGKE